MNGTTNITPENPAIENLGFLARMRNKAALAKMGVSTAIMVGAASFPAFAAEGDPTGININFDVTEMFKFANIIISSLMPVVYITAGLGIGFLIINSLKNAFH